MKPIVVLMCMVFLIIVSCSWNREEAEHQQKEKLLVGWWKETKNGCRLYNQMIFKANGDLKAMVGRHQWLAGYYKHVKANLYDIVVPEPRHHEITIKVQGNQMKMSAAYVDYTCTMIKKER
ncbi:hypothetical protein MK805_14645 [Shimazuella sp. AN120528]|uniref:hypothetical protein n=1 Tax=Shimazuella soli TaxID=1892854 RepID=UPI001F0EFD12|nr:hypothetical protein [Shimazuella soli]MCH5586178.1 hypothetical protein [Shimazuella soli]